jgi:hypothetical protein
MLRRRSLNRAIQLGLCGAAVFVLASAQAQAADKPAASKDKKACMAAYTAYKSALDREKAGKLREARELLQTCEQAGCAGLVPKCSQKYTQLGTQMPSVVPVVTDDSGAPHVDIQVKMDGELLTQQLDGKGLPIEAGLHEFTFGTETGVFATEKIMIVEGQRNRTIAVVLHTGEKKAAESTPEPEEAKGAAQADVKPAAAEASSLVDKGERAPSEKEKAADEPRVTGSEHWAMPKSAFPYLLGGVGIAAVGAGALMTLWGKKDNDALVSGCGQTQSCAQSSVDHVRTLYLASDIAIGAGVVALGVTTWLFASSRTMEQKPAPAAAYKVDVQPTRSGAFASVSGSF